MIHIETVRQIALSFDEAIELPHFELTSFRVKKKIFATLDIKNKRVCIKLSPVDQSVFCTYDNRSYILYQINGDLTVQLSVVGRLTNNNYI